MQNAYHHAVVCGLLAMKFTQNAKKMRSTLSKTAAEEGSDHVLAHCLFLRTAVLGYCARNRNRAMAEESFDCG